MFYISKKKITVKVTFYTDIFSVTYNVIDIVVAVINKLEIVIILLKLRGYHNSYLRYRCKLEKLVTKQTTLKASITKQT